MTVYVKASSATRSRRVALSPSLLAKTAVLGKIWLSIPWMGASNGLMVKQ